MLLGKSQSDIHPKTQIMFQVLQNFALSSSEKILGFHRLRAVHVRIPATSSSSSSQGTSQNSLAG